MTRILFCTVPEKGHLNPCIGPAQHLRAAGCDVAFYAPADISEQLLQAGGFAQLGERVPAARHDLSRGAHFAASIQDQLWLRRWIRTLLVEETPAQIDGIRQVLRDYQPDVVVIDPLLYAAAIAAHLQDLPWVALSNSLNPVLPEALDSELLRTVAELAPARDLLFARYGMTVRFRGCDVLSPYLTLALTTEALTGPAPAGVTLTGPALPQGARGDETGFPWERLNPALPLVYMSLGSQLYYHPDIFTKAIAATQDLDVQLVLSIGELAGSDLLPALDDKIIALAYVPQLAVLARASACITHGGANSVMEALAHGVPLLISPLCNDQFHSAWFVEQSGAGLRLDLRSASVAELRAAIETLLHSPEVRGKAAAIAASYRRDGSAEAAQRIRACAAENRQATAS